MSRHIQSDPANIKSSVIRLRVTASEAQLFKANAVEEYIRMKCIGEDSSVDIAATGVEKQQAKK